MIFKPSILNKHNSIYLSFAFSVIFVLLIKDPIYFHFLSAHLNYFSYIHSIIQQFRLIWIYRQHFSSSLCVSQETFCNMLYRKSLNTTILLYICYQESKAELETIRCFLILNKQKNKIC